MKKITKQEYLIIHKWIRDNYGKASKCEYCTNPAKRYDWALKKGCEYSRDRNCFIELCRSCHIKYDFTIERINKLSLNQKGVNNNFYGKTFNEEMKQKQRDKKDSFKIRCINIITGEIREFDSISLACFKLNLQKSNVLKCLKGINKQHKQWKYQKL